MKAERLLGAPVAPSNATALQSTTARWTVSDDLASAREALERGGYLVLAMDGTCTKLQVMGSGERNPTSLSQQLSSKDFFFVLWKEPGKKALLLYHRGVDTPVARRSTLLQVNAEIVRKLEPLAGLWELQGVSPEEIEKVLAKGKRD